MKEQNSYLAAFDRFAKNAPDRQAWLRDARRDAIARFAELGFPTTREEDWKYTNVAPIADVPFEVNGNGGAGLREGDLSQFIFGEADECHVVFVNGRYSRELSALCGLPEGVRVSSLASALETGREIIEPHLARHADPAGNAFTALNTAFFRDGAFVYVPEGTDLKKIIHLVFIATPKGEPAAYHPRNLILVGEGSRARIVESYGGAGRGVYMTNAVTEIVSGSGSTVDHHKIQREREDAFHVATLQVLQQRDSRVSSHSISLGGSLVRNDVRCVLDGEGGECTLNGLYVTRGRQHVDNHTSIDHAKPHCDSRESYKGILDDSSSAVFNGRIVVRPDAQKTNARQTNKNLLLSEDALINTQPQLEIFADDVKCTHGATIGRLDDEALFYLRTRGIEEQAARTLLTYAFASEILGEVRIKPIQCQIDLVLLSRLSRG